MSDPLPSFELTSENANIRNVKKNSNIKFTNNQLEYLCFEEKNL